MKKYLSLLLCYLLFIIPAVSQEAYEDIIAKHLEISGLANAGREIKQYSISGEFLQNKMKFPMKIQAKIPDKYKMVMVFNSLNFIKVSNGKNMWEYNPMMDTLITTINKEPLAEDFIDRWTGGLYKFKNGGLNAKLLGTATIEDIDVYKFEIIFGDVKRIYFIDKLSYLIIRIDDDLNENKVTYYSDYRKIGKYYVPFSMVGYEGGVPAISMKFKEVKLNQPIADSVFDKPGTSQ